MAEARRKTTFKERIEIVNYCINHNCDYKNTAARFDVSCRNQNIQQSDIFIQRKIGVQNGCADISKYQEQLIINGYIVKFLRMMKQQKIYFKGI